MARKASVVSVNHQCPRNFDIRSLQHALDAHSYRQVEHSVLSSFTFSGFAEKVFAPGSIDLEIGGRELSRLHDDVMCRPSRSTRAEDRERLADEQLTRWLKQQAAEDWRPARLLFCDSDISLFQSSTRSSALVHIHSLMQSTSLPSSPRNTLVGAYTPLPKLCLLSRRHHFPVHLSSTVTSANLDPMYGERCIALSVLPYSVSSHWARFVPTSRRG